MKLESVNVGLPREVEWNGKTVTTGIYKEPVEDRVKVKELNLDGDGQADLTVHGGPNMAVYVFPAEHYDEWKKVLPEVEFPIGVFGENLTISGVSEDPNIGDKFRIGMAEFTITQPRMPCFKLGIRFGDQGFVKRFLDSKRTGFYFKVLKEGEVGAGDPVELISQDPNDVSVRDIVDLYIGEGDAELMRRAVNVEALPDSWKDHFQKILDAEQK